ncbi:MAG TPA: DNA alkylation repair protein [Pseudobacteroides sp.]|nr:DNA alkylation repair protein [Pseudobacteroides sp.]
MKKSEALELANRCVKNIETNSMTEVWKELTPILEQKTKFPILDLIGEKFGERSINYIDTYIKFYDELSKQGTMGGYVIIAQALISLLKVDYNLCFCKAKEYLIEGNEWYVCDTFGDRVLGYSLLFDFERALSFLEEYQKNYNNWVRRSVGVAVHLFSKRCRDNENKAKRLLELLSVQLYEKDYLIVKGVGWGIKTTGRYYPDLVASFLKDKIKDKRIPALMFRKAITYLNSDVKNELQILNMKKVHRLKE